MAKQEGTPEGVIQVFVEGLHNTPGWIALSRKKQDELLEYTSHIQQYRQLQMLGEFGELMELYRVQQLLEGEEMSMANYLRALYPERAYRTIQRKQAAFAELAATIPDSIMRKISASGSEVLGRFDRIAKAALGDIRRAVREIPLLPVSTDEGAEKYLEEIDAKLVEDRKKRRRRGITAHRDDKEASRMAVNALLHYLRGCNLKTSAQQRQWLTRVFGYAMEAQAISGTLRVGRMPIPDGFLIRRGRPTGWRKKKEAA